VSAALTSAGRPAEIFNPTCSSVNLAGYQVLYNTLNPGGVPVNVGVTLLGDSDFAMVPQNSTISLSGILAVRAARRPMRRARRGCGAGAAGRLEPARNTHQACTTALTRARAARGGADAVQHAAK